MYGKSHSYFAICGLNDFLGTVRAESAAQFQAFIAA